MAKQEDKKVKFFPYHAINEFMRNDYRMTVVRTVLTSLPNMPDGLRSKIDRLTRKNIKVPGFRNSAKAPVGVRMKPTADAFEKKPDLVAAILAAWSEKHYDLRQQVYDLLLARGWDILPLDADRTKIPGFLTEWPKEENFDILTDAYKKMFPDGAAEDDDISLMIVWLSGRLPYQMEEDED